MKKITVNTQAKYDVIVGSGVVRGYMADGEKHTQGRKICIVSDENVYALHGERVRGILENIGKSTSVFTFKPGEDSKNIDTLNDILEFLAENDMKRSDALVTLGGGVAGDLGGFAASVYLRGIGLIHIPTSLLAMVDSSVGGKTAINLSKGKNLAGSFYQPKLVLCDLELLETLPRENYTEGMAEVIKYAAVFDENLFEKLKNSPKVTEDIVARCIDLKRSVVEEDELDKGARQILNFGHTIGHSIEKLSGFAVSHGNAVAIGMAVMTKGCQKLGMCESGTYEKLRELLVTHGLPYSTRFTAEELLNGAKNDKKSGSSGINLIIPRKIGSAEVLKTDFADFFEIIKAGKEI